MIHFHNFPGRNLFSLTVGTLHIRSAYSAKGQNILFFMMCLL